MVLSEAELTAFVSRNLDPRDWPFEHSSIVLRSGGTVEVIGTIPVRRLAAESPFAFAASILPAAWQMRPITLDVVAHAVVERQPSNRLRLDVQQLRVGRQRVPTVALRLLLEPATLRFVRLPLPDTVQDIQVENGRAVIRPTSSRRRT